MSNAPAITEPMTEKRFDNPLSTKFESLRRRHRTIGAHGIVMAVLFVAALVIGWLILPGTDERIAALERDGQVSRSLQMLEEQFTAGDRRERTLFQLHRLHEYYGNRDRARQVLELLAAQRPRDTFVQRQLAQHYKQTQDEPAHMRLLASQLAVRYSEPNCRELIGMLRRNARYAEEQKTIVTCRTLGYRRPDDLIRLAYLQASDGNLAETAQLLKAVDDRRWLKESRERLMLFASLIETKQEPEALRRGVRWLKGLSDHDLALDMIYKLVEANRNDLGLQLAREVGGPGDPVSLAVAEIMIDQVQYGAARAFLSGWLEQAKVMDTETATRFVTAAIDAEDPVLAMKGAERHGLKRFEQAELSALAEVMIGRGYVPEFDRIRVMLQPDQLSTNPMLWAAVELRQGRVETARSILGNVRVEGLDERRLGYLAKIVDMAGRPQSPSGMLRPRQLTRAEPATSEGTAQQPSLPRPRIIGPAQERVRQRVQRRTELRQTKQPIPRKRTEPQATTPRPAGPAAGNPSPGVISPIPFPFPQSQ
jgi:hypothetical protein